MIKALGDIEVLNYYYYGGMNWNRIQEKYISIGIEIGIVNIS